jgi:hypothetical protein
MNVGQRAMVAAMIYPKPEKGGRGKKGNAALHFPMVNKNDLSWARRVLRDAVDLINSVLERF